MGRVLVIVDKPEMSTSVLQLALNGIKEGREHVYVGLLINQYEHSTVKQSETISFDQSLTSETEERLLKLGAIFQNNFHDEGISTKVCFGECLNTKQLVKESAFADLLVIDSATFVDYLLGKSRFRHLRGLFEEVQCPLLVIPSNFVDFHELVILKESEETIVKAIKSLKSTLTQSLRNAEVSLLGVIPVMDEEFEDEKRLMGFLKQYFRNVGILLTSDKSIEEFTFDFVSNAQMPLLVMAGYDEKRIKKLILPLLTNANQKGISLYIENPF